MNFCGYSLDLMFFLICPSELILEGPSLWAGANLVRPTALQDAAIPP